MPKTRAHNLAMSLDGAPESYECVELVDSPSAAHVRLARWEALR